jgi:hypothetical protein
MTSIKTDCVRPSRIALTLAFSLGLASAAFAQVGNTAPNSADSSTNSMAKPGLSATTSDAGNMGAGASSSKIGTGTTSHGGTGMGSQNSGVMGTEAPAATGHGATGANANTNQTSTP